VDVTIPSITGSPVAGGTLTALTGAWSGDEIAYTYQWQACNASGTDCTNIAGATSSTYEVSASEAGQTLRVEVTATNAGGSATVPSAATATVPAAAQGSTPGSSAPVTTTPGLVSLVSPGASFTVSPEWALVLPLSCTATPTGCDANGLLTIALPQLNTRRSYVTTTRLPHVATSTTVIAKFEGTRIASGETRLVKVTLTAAAITQLRARGVHRVLVTLTINNRLTGGPAVNTTEHLWLLVPSLARQCLAPAGDLSSSGLGQFSLGMTRGRADRIGRHVPRARVFQFYCVAAGPGVRIAYATRRLKTSLASAQRRHLRTGIILALTGNRHYSVRGITAGDTVAKASAKLHLGPSLKIGKNTWYVVSSGKAAWVFKTRHGVIDELGVASRALTGTLAEQRRFLTHVS
jgi:hypothetical protein